MQKNKILNLIILFILFLGIMFNPVTINADSGFDSSYDSGSSSFDSSSSDGDGGGSIHLFIAFGAFLIFEGLNKITKNKLISGIIIFPSYFFLILLIFGLINTIISIIMLIFLLCGENKVAKKKFDKLPKTLSNEEIFALDANLNLEEFKTTAFNIYKDIQIAWMNFDLDSIKNLISDEIYNMYTMQLDTLKIKGQQNIMSDIELHEFYITNITFENNVETIETIMTVECYDYIVDNNKKVIRGNKNNKMIYTYNITFTKYTIDKVIKYCPNCGAEIDINSTGKCDYCASTIINKEAKWVMTKKQMLNQRRK